MVQRLDSRERENSGGGPSTAAERAYAEVRMRILDGRFPAGHRLKEIELANEFGLSRTPVRDALSRLSVEGLVEFRPNLGATVSVWSEAQIEQMFKIRALLEPFAAEIAAQQITDEKIEELRQLCSVMEAAARRRNEEDLERLAAANARFHRIVIDAAQSEHLAKLISLTVDAPLTLRTFAHYSRDEIERSMQHHRDLVDALAHRDPAWCGSVMRTHILAAIGTARKSHQMHGVTKGDGEARPGSD
jgi:DNA-binding GntR family transcriptional regulator